MQYRDVGRTLAGTPGLGRVVGNFIFGVQSPDCPWFGAAAARIAIVARVACLARAAGAMRVDPNRILQRWPPHAARLRPAAGYHPQPGENDRSERGYL
jgi:hypothetical protein